MREKSWEECILAQEKTKEFEKAQGSENPEKSKALDPEKDLNSFEYEIELLDIAGPNAREIIGQDCNIMSACAARPYPLVVDSAKGSIIRDVDGERVLLI